MPHPLSLWHLLSLDAVMVDSVARAKQETCTLSQVKLFPVQSSLLGAAGDWGPRISVKSLDWAENDKW